MPHYVILHGGAELEVDGPLDEMTAIQVAREESRRRPRVVAVHEDGVLWAAFTDGEALDISTL